MLEDSRIETWLRLRYGLHAEVTEGMASVQLSRVWAARNMVSADVATNTPSRVMRRSPP